MDWYECDRQSAVLLPVAGHRSNRRQTDAESNWERVRPEFLADPTSFLKPVGSCTENLGQTRWETGN
jgi:hypothetical protein